MDQQPIVDIYSSMMGRSNTWNGPVYITLCVPITYMSPKKTIKFTHLLNTTSIKIKVCNPRPILLFYMIGTL